MLSGGAAGTSTHPQCWQLVQNAQAEPLQTNIETCVVYVYLNVFTALFHFYLIFCNWLCDFFLFQIKWESLISVIIKPQWHVFCGKDKNKKHVMSWNTLEVNLCSTHWAAPLLEKLMTLKNESAHAREWCKTAGNVSMNPSSFSVKNVVAH